MTGDPTDVPQTITAIKKLIGKYPIFGICLGHQIISLAYGAKTYKLKFGHRGGNHPVKNLKTNKIEITSQNHSYAVDADSLLETPLSVTHINLLDQTVEGVVCERDHVFSVQYHPESAPVHRTAPICLINLSHLSRRDANMPKRTDLKKILVIGSVRLSSVRRRSLTTQEHRHASLSKKKDTRLFSAIPILPQL